MYISLLRTPVYSAHPIGDRKIADSDISHDHVDMGKREFEYRITADTDNIDADAEIYNQPVYPLAFFPSGSGIQTDTRCELDNKNLILTRFGKTDDGKIIARIFNSADSEQSGKLTTPFGNISVNLKPFEFETYDFN